MHLTLTGQIASGKSTVLMELARLGWLTVRTDELAWNVAYSEEGQAFQQKHFDGRVPLKAEHRARFLADADFRAAWEGFIHPRVNAAWRAFLAANPRANCVVELPLLFEKKLEGAFDCVVVCTCSPQVAVHRWQSRGRTGGTPEDYRALEKLLLPIELKRQRADFILENNSTLEVLQAEVQKLHNKLLNFKK